MATAEIQHVGRIAHATNPALATHQTLQYIVCALISAMGIAYGL
ncbi:hypothetical protein ABIA27_001251 [Sinorhizobium fredii]